MGADAPLPLLWIPLPYHLNSLILVSELQKLDLKKSHSLSSVFMKWNASEMVFNTFCMSMDKQLCQRSAEIISTLV